MSIVIQCLISAVIAYLIGSINPSYIIARAKGFDIRSSGSRNAGGSNAILTMGKKVGIFCCLADIFKGFAVIKIMMFLFPQAKLVYACSASACIIGHMFPIFMHFKGGKGLACLGGSILAYSPVLAAIMLAIEIVLVLVVDYLVVVPVTASIAYPIVYGSLAHNWVGAAILGIASLGMLYKHKVNFVRIGQGTELHFSYLWNKQEEKDRISENIKKIDESQLDSVWREKK